MSQNDWLAFEQPLNERVRTFLRLETLFAQYAHHAGDDSEWGLRASMHSLLDILSVVSRSDLKVEVVKELSEQHAALSRLSEREGVDQSRLQATLREIDSVMNALNALSSQFAQQALRESEFLVSILNRATIPGGTCGFDLPLLHHWLNMPEARARRDLEAWYADLDAFQRAISLYLQLLRSSTTAHDCRAEQGTHIHTPERTYALVRVLMPRGSLVYPEISAGRHRFSIRFLACSDVNQRPLQSDDDITFRLQCCVL
ncbi:cell division protein ZapD [Algiphilus sp.]|uniref:cell division protein ZapD n=1 Tax=Algiphilus sp. TaxID=1872431 RepID=UPI0025C6EE60|nr:cell division protein ZapD [Algiphilus sp.]MCK5770074.1 cell division protein ZapD [Algiphilus sp.]